MPFTFVLVIISLKIISKFVQRIVSEVGKEILLCSEVEGVGRGGKTCEPIFVNINSKRIPAGYGYIYPHIKLESIGQKWIMNVLTYNYTVFLLLQNLLH